MITSACLVGVVFMSYPFPLPIQRYLVNFSDSVVTWYVGAASVSNSAANSPDL